MPLLLTLIPRSAWGRGARARGSGRMVVAQGGGGGAWEWPGAWGLGPGVRGRQPRARLGIAARCPGARVPGGFGAPGLWRGAWGPVPLGGWGGGGSGPDI